MNTPTNPLKVALDELSIAQKDPAEKPTGAGKCEFTPVEEKRIILNKTTADWYIRLPKVKHERHITSSLTKRYEEEIKRGKFMWHKVFMIVCYVKETSTMYGLNCQHVCQTVMGQPMGLCPTINFERYEVDTMEECLKLYSSIDNNPGRTSAHMTKCLMGDCSALDLESFLNVASESSYPKLYSSIISGFKFWKGLTRRSSSEVAEMMKQKEYHELIKTVARILEPTTFLANDEFIRMKSVPIVAAMFATSSIHRANSMAFWNSVISGDTSDGNTHMLFKTILKWDLKTLSDSQKMYNACAKMWKAWRKNSDPIKNLAATLPTGSVTFYTK